MSKLLIGGELVDAVKKETYEVRNPATGDVVDHAAKGSGDDVQQAVDAAESAFKEWSDTNPYRDAEGHDRDEILRVGSSAYNQNCARCHGLGGVSGGIAPDLRMLAPDYDGDEWYVYRVQNGAVRNGAVYMPKMTEHLNQEALWAIRSWLESVSDTQ